jgi:hypothetical protein
MAVPVGICVPAGHLGHPEGLAVDLQSRQLLAEAVVVPVEYECIDDGGSSGEVICYAQVRCRALPGTKLT